MANLPFSRALILSSINCPSVLLLCASLVLRFINMCNRFFLSVSLDKNVFPPSGLTRSVPLLF